MLTRTTKGIKYNAKRCVTCGVCISVCPTKALTSDYTYGKDKRICYDDSLCVNCGRCLSICPAAYMDKILRPPSLDTNNTKSYIAWAKNSDVRFFAASGGVARTLIKEASRQNFVDAIYSLYEADNDSMDIEGRWLVDSPDLLKIPASIYRPIFWGRALAAVNPQWKRVLIIGLPCQIRSAQLYFSKYWPGIKVFLVVIFCKKQKTEKMTLCCLREMGLSPKYIKDFRYRGDGYPGFFRHPATKHTLPYFYPPKMWYKSGCRFCLDSFVQDSADMVLADPQRLIDHDEKRGKNLLLVQSDQGFKLLALIKKSITIESISIEDAYYKSMGIAGLDEKARYAELLRHRFSCLHWTVMKECCATFTGEWLCWFFGVNSKALKVVRFWRKRT